MNKINSTVTIDKPLAAVWQYLDNPDHMGEWLDNFVKYEHVSGEPGQVGSKGKHYYKEGGREIVMDEEILERIDREYLRLRLTNKMMDMEIENFLKKVDDTTTELVATMVVLRMSAFMKLMGALAGGAKKMQQRQDKQLAKLKAAIEAQP